MASIVDIIIELMEVRARGEPVDAASVLQRYPEHAKRLRWLLQGMASLDTIWAGPGNMFRGPWEGAAPNGPLPMQLLLDDPPEGFEIIHELQRGAEGVVYEAIQRSTRRTVALKMLYRYASPQLEHEAQLVARLRHPNVVTVYEAGVYYGLPYWALEMVEGAPLDKYVALHTLNLRSMLRLFVKICAGVAHAHQCSVLHRDLKPSNIVIDPEGEPRVLDFGLAKQVDAPPQNGVQAEGGAFVGTMAYSSPEQLAGRNEDIDLRSDVYSLGVILYELLTQTLPYRLPDDPHAALGVITKSNPPRPSSRRRGLSDDLDCIVLKALAVDRDCRYPTVNALADEVERYLDRKPLAQKLDRPLYVARKMIRRHPIAAAALAMVVASVVAIGAVTWSWLHERSVALATMNRRFEQVRLRDLQSLNEYQMDVASTNWVNQAQLLPPDQAAAYLARYRHPPLDPEGILDAIFQKVPADALVAVRARPNDVNAELAAALAVVDEDLDALGLQLATEHLRFVLIEGNVITAISWERTPLAPATGICALYVHRAYRRHAEGDVTGAAENIRAATRLADDVGDGVMADHKASAYLCHRENLRFLAVALSDVIGTDDARPYLQLARGYPEPLLAAPALRPVCLGLRELVDVALVTNQDGSNERVDLFRLDAFLNDSLTALGAMTKQNADFRLTPDGAFALMDKYILCARDWDNYNAFQIREQIELLDQEIARERTDNPFLWLVAVPSATYLYRVEVRSLRQVVRLVGYVEQYRDSYGNWPTTLRDALPPDAAGEIIDPRTGSAFVYDDYEGMPRLRSLSTLVGKHTSAADGDPAESELEVIFPVDLVHVAPAESAPTLANTDTTPQGG